MSEDCDFRIRLKAQEKPISRHTRRNHLRTLRYDVLAALREHGFIIDDKHVRVRNEGQFIALRASYPSAFALVDGIKPFIALEFFLGAVKQPTAKKPVTTMLRQFLGKDISHAEFPVNSVAIIETAAEKWVGLTRRIATSAHRTHYRDPHLVRHLYDLHEINRHNHFTEDFETLVPHIVMEDRKQYKTHNDDYYCHPIKEITRALEELTHGDTWRELWQQFVDTMVFNPAPPTFEAVLTNLQQKSDIALSALSEVDFA